MASARRWWASTSTRSRSRTASPTAAGSRERTLPPATPDPGLPHDEWQARVVAGRGPFPSLRAVYGLLRLESGVLAFLPEGSPAPLWSARAETVTATRLGYFEGSDFSLRSEAVGEVRVVASRERVNRFVGNEDKRRRQRQYAEEFLAALVLSGGTVA